MTWRPVSTKPPSMAATAPANPTRTPTWSDTGSASVGGNRMRRRISRPITRPTSVRMTRTARVWTTTALTRRTRELARISTRRRGNVWKPVAGSTNPPAWRTWYQVTYRPAASRIAPSALSTRPVRWLITANCLPSAVRVDGTGKHTPQGREQLQVGARHEPDEVLEARAQLPAEVAPRLGVAANQVVDLSRRGLAEGVDGRALVEQVAS